MEKPTIPTEEQIKEYEKTMFAHYQEKLPFLRIKAEFDMLQADIAEARIRSLSANSQFAQAMAEQAKATESKEKKEEKK